MTKFLQYVAIGLADGSMYALVALGIALIYRSTRILNFAHGDITTAGIYFAIFILGFNLNIGLASFLAILSGSILAMLFYFFVVVPAQRREANELSLILLTVGFGLIIQGLVSYFGGSGFQSFPSLIPDEKVMLGKVVLTQLDIGTFFVGSLSCLFFYLLVQKTKIGLAMRAVSENLPAAQTMSIPTRKILSLSWGLAALLGVIAGLFLAPKLQVDTYFMMDPFLKGFAAAILGGLNSLPGAIVGGLILGVVESLVGGYISIAFMNTVAFLIIIIVLIFRPEGLLGKEFIERV